MIRLDGHRTIRTTPQKLFQLVGRLESHSQVTGLWMTADLLERRANGITVQYRGYLAGIPVESVQHTTLQPPHRIEFRQTRGTFRTFHGAYAFKPADGDTELVMSLEVDVGISLISETAARRLLLGYVEHTLDKFKLTAERELPRPTRRTKELPKPLPASPGESPPVPVAPVSAPAPATAPAPDVKAANPSPPPARGKRRRRRRRRRRGPAQAPTTNAPAGSSGGGPPTL